MTLIWMGDDGPRPLSERTWNLYKAELAFIDVRYYLAHTAEERRELRERKNWLTNRLNEANRALRKGKP